jgi:hypothetical protein
LQHNPPTHMSSAHKTRRESDCEAVADGITAESTAADWRWTISY